MPISDMASLRTPSNILTTERSRSPQLVLDAAVHEPTGVTVGKSPDAAMHEPAGAGVVEPTTASIAKPTEAATDNAIKVAMPAEKAEATLSLPGHVPMTYKSALDTDKNCISEAAFFQATMQLYSTLWSQQPAMRALVRHHLGLQDVLSSEEKVVSKFWSEDADDVVRSKVDAYHQYAKDLKDLFNKRLASLFCS
jgi:hypothetical protein